MSAEKDLAIVLRVVDFSETSCVVTVFTRGRGKISALAKGARRPKSPFEAALDLLAVCRIVFLHKSSDALDLLTEAKLERRFRAAQNDLSRLYAGYYVAELLAGMTDEDDPHPELFDAAEATLKELDNDGEIASVILRFEMTALEQLGHLPSLADCVGCGGSIAGSQRVAFGMLAGGVLCSQCRQGERQVLSVRGKVIDALHRFSQADDQWRQGLDSDVRGELRGVLNRYLSHLLGRRPKMHTYLGMLADS